MIFVTVGTQLPFDRLIEAVDRLAPSLSEPVIAQTGKCKYVCRNIETHIDIPPQEFEASFKSCSRVIAHAGIGTVLNAQKLGKPIILVPRLARFGEHRNDHQLATCKMLGNRPGISIVQEPSELTVELIEAASDPAPAANNENRQNIVSYLRETIGTWDAR